MSFGALAFLNPWLLSALLALPIIYWLLRAVPPRPAQVEFPPTRILVGLENEEKTAEKTPWWLTLIRLLAAAFVILALAEPVLNPSKEAGLAGEGPVVVFVDNGWAAASHWPERVRMIDRFIGEAESSGRPVVIVGTAAASKLPVAKIESPNDARSTASALVPQPFEPDRAGALSALENALKAANSKNPNIIWLPDGLDQKPNAADIGKKLAALAGNGTFAVLDETKGHEPLGLTARLGDKGKLEALVLSHRRSGTRRHRQCLLSPRRAAGRSAIQAGCRREISRRHVRSAAGACAIRWRASNLPAKARRAPSTSSMRQRNGIGSD